MATYNGVRHQYRPREPRDDGTFDGLEAYPAGNQFGGVVIRDRTQATAWIEGRAVDLLEVL